MPLSNGINELTSLVVNAERTESQTTTVLVEYNGDKAKTDLFILSIGINSYISPNDILIIDRDSSLKGIIIKNRSIASV